MLVSLVVVSPCPSLHGCLNNITVNRNGAFITLIESCSHVCTYRFVEDNILIKGNNDPMLLSVPPAAAHQCFQITTLNLSTSVGADEHYDVKLIKRAVTELA